eukprot:6661021-Prymnesium_polylepis.1
MVVMGCPLAPSSAHAPTALAAAQPPASGAHAVGGAARRPPRRVAPRVPRPTAPPAAPRAA